MALKSSQQIKYGAVLSYLGIALYILIGLLYTPWMIKCIGQADYGLYTLAYSIISMFLFDFGISSAVQRFIAKYVAENREDKVNLCLSIVCKLYLLIDGVLLLTLIGVYLAIPYIYRELTPEQISQFKVVYLIASAFSVLSFPFMPVNGILSAHEKFVQLKTCDLFSKILTVGICVIFLWFGYGLYALVLTNALVGLMIIAVKMVILHSTTPIKINFSLWDKSELKSILSFSAWTMIVSLCQRCIFNLAPSILGLFEGARAIAVLGIAIALEGYNFTFAYALNGLFLPKISRIRTNNGDILPLMIKVGRIQILSIGLVLIGFILVGRIFIENWLGTNYIDAYSCTLLFIFPAFLLLPADVADQTLIADGKVKARGIVFISMAVVNVPLSLFLTKYYGLTGLAVSIFIAYMVRNIILYITYYRILHINVLHFFKATYFNMMPGILAAILISYFSINFIELSGWKQVFVSAVIVSLVYSLTMYFFALNTSERQLISNKFKLWRIR